jgi:nucleoside 2-deoxyribosyltransferase
MRLYVAGPLFTQAERAWNETLAASLTAAGHDVFLPQTEVKAIASLNADAIFQLDVDGVRSAEAVVAILDGADPDSGTCFECGLAYALGIPIVAVRTDFRAGGDALPGQKLATINLMLAQAASAIVNLPDPATTFDVLLSAVISALEGLPSTKPVDRTDNRSVAGSW